MYLREEFEPDYFIDGEIVNRDTVGEEDSSWERVYRFCGVDIDAQMHNEDPYKQAEEKKIITLDDFINI